MMFKNPQISRKPITFANTYDKVSLYHGTSYFGEYINGEATDVLESCSKIGTSKVREYDGFNARGLVDIIKEASLCVVSAHGKKDGIDCVYPIFGNNGLVVSAHEQTLYSDYIDSLPQNYFSGTKCVLLSACLTAKGGTNSFAYKLSQKGVQAVVGFETETNYDYDDDETGEMNADKYDQLYIQKFLEALGDGKSVQKAAYDAYLVLGKGLGFESYRVYGNTNLIVKN